MMTRVAVVAFDSDSVLFPDLMPVRRQQLRESIPIVSIKRAIFKMFYLAV
jgi:hypothetical protein